MKNNLITFNALLLIFIITAAFHSNYSLERTYVIEDHSLVLAGSSNVNNFSCICNQEFSEDVVRFESTLNGHSFHFEQATLALSIPKFDCGNKGINKDMHKALKADQYPMIQIQLLEVKHKTDKLIIQCDDWVPMEADAIIRLAGYSCATTLDIEGKMLSDGDYQFKSVKDLRMSDFNISPPTALLGLIKVHNEITIHIELVVTVESP